MRTLLYRRSSETLFQGPGQGEISAPGRAWEEVSPHRRSTMSLKARLILMAAAAALTASLASAQPVTLFGDGFGPKPLGGWTASPLGLAANWDASSGAAAYNGGGHTQLW